MTTGRSNALNLLGFTHYESEIDEAFSNTGQCLRADDSLGPSFNHFQQIQQNLAAWRSNASQVRGTKDQLEAVVKKDDADKIFEKIRTTASGIHHRLEHQRNNDIGLIDRDLCTLDRCLLDLSRLLISPTSPQPTATTSTDTSANTSGSRPRRSRPGKKRRRSLHRSQPKPLSNTELPPRPNQGNSSPRTVPRSKPPHRASTISHPAPRNHYKTLIAEESAFLFAGNYYAPVPPTSILDDSHPPPRVFSPPTNDLTQYDRLIARGNSTLHAGHAIGAPLLPVSAATSAPAPTPTPRQLQELKREPKRRHTESDLPSSGPGYNAGKNLWAGNKFILKHCEVKVREASRKVDEAVRGLASVREEEEESAADSEVSGVLA